MGVADEDDTPPLHHDQDAWELYTQELQWRQNGNDNADDAAYLPPPDVVAWRAVITRWLRDVGFNEIFIESCLQRDNPRIETVVDMVAKYGVQDTYRRCRAFLVKNERGDPI